MANQQQERQERQQGQSQGSGHGAFTVQIEYQTPHLGIWNGQLVSIAALGNAEGFSPANLIQGTGEQNQRVVSIEEVRDLTLCPATTDEMQNLLRGPRRDQDYRR